MSKDETPIKVIIVRDCIGCPYSEIVNPEDAGGELWCSDKLFIGNMKDVCSHGFINTVYDNCDLIDISEFGPDIENFFRSCYGNK